MYPSAIFFGAIGTLAETSELQRQAFNAAFAEAGLDWVWEQPEYLDMLRVPGGQSRVEHYAQSRGETVDAALVHALKVRHFEGMSQQLGLVPRAGVTELMQAAQAMSLTLGLITTTTPQTVGLMLNGLSQDLHPGDFSIITDKTNVARPKPDPEVYLYALRETGLSADQVIAIEDTPESAQAAIGAGIRTIAFPGLAAQGRAFPGTIRMVDALSPDLVDMQIDMPA